MSFSTSAANLLTAVAWVEQEMRYLKVDIQLQTRVDEGFLQRFRPDAVVLATGATPTADLGMATDDSIPILTLDEAAAVFSGLAVATARLEMPVVTGFLLLATTANAMLCVFNMLPLPPLDGGRVLTGLLPYSQARLLAAVEPFGFLILAALIMTGWLRFLVNNPISFVTRVLL